MDSIVRYSSLELDKAELITDSLIIAEKGEVTHKSLKNLIQKHKKKITEKFGVMPFKKAKPNGDGRPETYYELTEPQATFILVLMKNTENVIEFKADLVSEFFRMRSDLGKRNETRDYTKINHKGFNDSILHSPENERMHGRAFSNFERLIYKTIFGLQKKALCELRGYPYKSNIPLKSFLDEGELKKVEEYEIMVKNFLDAGMDYAQIKEILERLGSN